MRIRTSFLPASAAIAILVALAPVAAFGYSSGSLPIVTAVSCPSASSVSVTWNLEAGKPTSVAVYDVSGALIHSFRAISGPEYLRGQKTVTPVDVSGARDIYVVLGSRFGPSATFSSSDCYTG